MGKVEKVVVLSVLFLITLILVISLSGPAEDPERLAEVPRVVAGAAGSGYGAPGAGPVGGAGAERVSEPTAREALRRPRLERAGEVGTSAGPRSAQPSPRAPQPSTDRLLNASLGDAPERASEPGSLLRTEEGLTPSYLDEFRFYTWRSGDTWRSVAERYYGDDAGLERLQRDNEDRPRMEAGDQILIRAFDPDAAPGPRAVARPAGAGAGTYVVAEGDSLWRIAETVYRDGSRWGEIFDANRDQLPSEDALVVGQVLRVP